MQHNSNHSRPKSRDDDKLVHQKLADESLNHVDLTGQLNRSISRAGAAYQTILEQLSEGQLAEGYWTGRLSTSALSTATAISALSVFRSAHARKSNSAETDRDEADRDDADFERKVLDRACAWLKESQNADGGFGDTDRSYSNIATTYLVLAAWKLAGWTDRIPERVQRAQQYVDRAGGWQGLRDRYGKDKTFVVPILTNCAIAGMIAWNEIPPLPFEAAALPQSWYRWARMPVVSYAVPALVAIGQARFHFLPPTFLPLRTLRHWARRRTLSVLARMQPDSGGYLEATPLTSFVLMSLAAIGLQGHSVSIRCRKFLLDSILEDGSWPIDTNLATWVTSLTISSTSMPASFSEPSISVGSRAVDRQDAHTQNPRGAFLYQDRSLVDDRTIHWLLSCQHTVRHPFTGAEPGGWAWTNLSGAVPDADDTPAALLAIHDWMHSNRQCNEFGAHIEAASEDDDANDQAGSLPLRDRCIVAVGQGLRWLLQLQNRDGGWPTFCRGRGSLPFDRSGSDLTAHAVRAMESWLRWSNGPLAIETDWPRDKMRRSIERGYRFLLDHQAADGSWVPLWFGNQDAPHEENRIYGTGRVLLPFCLYNNGNRKWVAARDRGITYLLQCQRADGSWGGGASVCYESGQAESESGTIEETAVALQALIAYRYPGAGASTASNPNDYAARINSLNANDRSGELIRSLDQEIDRTDDHAVDRAIEIGMDWLCRAVERRWPAISLPIGFYFAKLWYHEQLYPWIFSAAALKGYLVGRSTFSERQRDEKAPSGVT